MIKYFAIIAILLLTGCTTQNEPIQSHRSYELQITSDTDNLQPQQQTTLTYKIKNDKGEILKNYEIAHEKIMHLIVVRKDLQQFQHVHPEFDSLTGEFTVQLTFPTEGPYRIFPDFTPGDDNPQKLAITVYEDINVGNIKNYKPTQLEPDARVTKTVYGYEVAFNFLNLKSKQESQYSLSIKKNGQPVADLQQYLGALGHSVILKEGTLDFIHTHALEAGHSMGHGSVSSAKGPEIHFAATFPEPGNYKIFTQFKHKGKVITTDYVIEVS